MPDNTQHVFNVQMVVKGDSRYRAYTELAKQLNDWFIKDAFEPAPYPEGSLLLWSTKEKE